MGGVAAFSIMKGRYLTDTRNAISGATPQRASCVITRARSILRVRARADATSTHGIANSSRFMHALNNVPDTRTERAHTLHMGFRSSAVVVDAWPTLCLTNLLCENDTSEYVQRVVVRARARAQHCNTV